MIVWERKKEREKKKKKETCRTSSFTELADLADSREAASMGYYHRHIERWLMRGRSEQKKRRWWCYLFFVFSKNNQLHKSSSSRVDVFTEVSARSPMNTHLWLWAIAAHVIVLAIVFEIYFTSPLVHGMQPVQVATCLFFGFLFPFK